MSAIARPTHASTSAGQGSSICHNPPHLQGSAPLPVAFFIGKTGVGKSSLIAYYAVGPEKPRIGDTLESETTTTLSYTCKVQNVSLTFYDTPGAQDTQGRDQQFLDDMLVAMQMHCHGIHKLFYCMEAWECRLDESQRQQIALIVTLLGGVGNIPAHTFYLCLTKANLLPVTKRRPLEEYRKVITQVVPGLQFEVLFHEEGNAKDFEKCMLDLIPHNVIQSSNMKKVQTLKMRMKEADAKGKKLGEEIEQIKAEKDEEKRKMQEEVVSYRIEAERAQKDFQEQMRKNELAFKEELAQKERKAEEAIEKAADNLEKLRLQKEAAESKLNAQKEHYLQQKIAELVSDKQGLASKVNEMGIANESLTKQLMSTNLLLEKEKAQHEAKKAILSSELQIKEDLLAEMREAKLLANELAKKGFFDHLGEQFQKLFGFLK